MFYQKKYLKYKNKYFSLKNMIGGASSSLDEFDFGDEPSAASQPVVLDNNERRKSSAIKILYNLDMNNIKFELEVPHEKKAQYNRIIYIDATYNIASRYRCKKCDRFAPNPRYVLEDTQLNVCWHCVNDYSKIPYVGLKILDIIRPEDIERLRAIERLDPPKPGQKIYKYNGDTHIKGSGYGDPIQYANISGSVATDPQTSEAINKEKAINIFKELLKNYRYDGTGMIVVNNMPESESECRWNCDMCFTSCSESLYPRYNLASADIDICINCVKKSTIDILFL